jgi:hypothetical protein
MDGVKNLQGKREPDADEQTFAEDIQPVFVDATGHRRRWMRMVGYVSAIACLIYAIVLVTSLIYGPITPGVGG